MKIEIKSATISGLTNIRVWEPEVADNFAEFVVLDIGEKGKKSSDEFAFLLATPEGLKGLDSESSILYARSLVVVERYDYDDLWGWLVNIVKGSEDNSWADCVNNLCKHFEYEYDGYKRKIKNITSHATGRQTAASLRFLPPVHSNVMFSNR